jgi:perosamine synthetase
VVSLDRAAKRDVAGLLRGGELSDWRGGPFSRSFEVAFAAMHGTKGAVALSSGTSALHCAYIATGVKPDDEVIIPAACYVSAVSAAVQMGAVPVICDIDPNTLSLDPVLLKQCISLKTRLIVPVHLWGVPSCMTEITRMSLEFGIPVVEDCAQAIGAKVDGRLVGTFGVAASYSFAPAKLISTGQGGMLLCNEQTLVDRVRCLANKGKGVGWHDYKELGYSYAMPELSAIAGLSGVRQLPLSRELRRRAVEIYREAFADTELCIPKELAGVEPSYFKCPIRLPERFRPLRDYFLEGLIFENVCARLTHPSALTIPWVSDVCNRRRAECGKPRETPVADRELPLVIELEAGPNLSEDDIWISAFAVLRVFRYVSALL